MNAVGKGFGALVRSARAQRELSQESLAAMLTDAGLALHSSAVSRIETGSRSVDLDEFFVMCHCLGLHPDEVLSSLQQQAPAATKIEVMREWVEAQDVLRNAQSRVAAARRMLAEYRSSHPEDEDFVQFVESLFPRH